MRAGVRMHLSANSNTVPDLDPIFCRHSINTLKCEMISGCDKKKLFSEIDKKQCRKWSVWGLKCEFLRPFRIFYRWTTACLGKRSQRPWKPFSMPSLFRTSLVVWNRWHFAITSSLSPTNKYHFARFRFSVLSSSDSDCSISARNEFHKSEFLYKHFSLLRGKQICP